MSRTILLLSVAIILAAVTGYMMISITKSADTDEVMVEVNYYEHWNLTITENGIPQSSSGFGRSETKLIKPSAGSWVIAVSCSKQDSSSSLLTVQLKTMDGSVLKKGHTLEPFGTVEFIFEIT